MSRQITIEYSCPHCGIKLNQPDSFYVTRMEEISYTGTISDVPLGEGLEAVVDPTTNQFQRGVFEQYVYCAQCNGELSAEPVMEYE